MVAGLFKRVMVRHNAIQALHSVCIALSVVLVSPAAAEWDVITDRNHLVAIKNNTASILTTNNGIASNIASIEGDTSLMQADLATIKTYLYNIDNETNMLSSIYYSQDQVESHLSTLIGHVDDLEALTGLIQAQTDATMMNSSGILYFSSWMQSMMEFDIVPQLQLGSSHLYDISNESADVNTNLLSMLIPLESIDDELAAQSPLITAIEDHLSGIPYDLGEIGNDADAIRQQLVDLVGEGEGGATVYIDGPGEGEGIDLDDVVPVDLSQPFDPILELYPEDPEEWEPPADFVVDSFAWTPPVKTGKVNWSVTVPTSQLGTVLGAGFGEDLHFETDMSWYDGTIRTAVHGAILAMTGLGAACYLYEELRRYA